MNTYQCNSPRARAGLSIFEASIDPSAAPAPTSVCISSIKRITSPLLSSTSFNMLFNLSSNSPLYLAPATSAPVIQVDGERVREREKTDGCRGTYPYREP